MNFLTADTLNYSSNQPAQLSTGTYSFDKYSWITGKDGKMIPREGGSAIRPVHQIDFFPVWYEVGFPFFAYFFFEFCHCKFPNCEIKF